MAIIAKLKYLHIAPRKVRLVADLIRGKSVEEAQEILNFTPHRASRPLLKLLKSSMANAKNSLQIETENLYISKIFVDEGPKLKRWHAQSRGRAAEIQKKSSHISLELSEYEKKKFRKTKRVEKKVMGKKKEKSAFTSAFVKTLADKESTAGKGEKEIPKKEKQKPIIKKEKHRPKIKQTMKRVFRRKSF